MILPQSPGMVRECSDVPELAEAGIRMSVAELAGTDVYMCVSSVSCKLLVACSHCLVCCFAGGVQCHPEKIPVLSESVQSLDIDTVLHSFELDVVDLFLHSSQEFESLSIVGGLGCVCFADRRFIRL